MSDRTTTTTTEDDAPPAALLMKKEIKNGERSATPKDELATEVAKREQLTARPDPEAQRARPEAKKPTQASEEEDEDKEERPKQGPRPFSKEMLALKTADHLSVKEWLTQLSGQASILIHVHRKEPKLVTDPRTGERKKVDGLVAKYDRTIDEDEIQQNHGGGTYQLIVKVRNARGNWEYFNARTIEIAGDPRLDDVPRIAIAPQQPQQPQSDPLTQNLAAKAFDFMAERARERPLPSSSAADVASAVAAAIAPFKAQLETMGRMLDNKDRELAAVRDQATKGDPYKDKLLDKMFDSDNARVSAIRTQHESEVRMLKEQQIAQENRLRDQHQRDLDRMERSHERELSSIKSSFDTQKAAMESSQATQKMVLDSEIKRLEREVAELKSELGALRAKKEQTVGEKIKEMKDLRELLGDESEGNDDEDKSTLVKVIEAAGQLPVVEALAQRFAGAGGTDANGNPPAAEQAPPPPPRRPRLIRDKRTGAVLAPGPDGRLVQVKKIVPPSEEGQAAVPPVDPAVIKSAVDFMENAFRSGTSPEDFAETARPFIPESVLGAIRALGIDEFMLKVAQLDGTSPLATQGGRNWRRRVASKLLGETDE